MRVGIVGAGITGLTAAYRLTKNGHKVTVFEKGRQAGGLVSGFKEKGWDWHLEFFYHHLFTSDRAAEQLITELGLKEKLFFLNPKTSIFYKNKISRFDSPLSLLGFPYLSWPEKIRVGLVTFYLKANPFWKNLEKTTASSWLAKFYGPGPYQILWEPLLKAKFGLEAEKISMSWFWARIKKRSQTLGYLEGGLQTLIDKLGEEVRKNGSEICPGQNIRRFNDLNHFSKFDQIILTLPSSSFLSLYPNLPKDYQTKLNKLKMIGALNLIVILKEKFLADGTYWLNINEGRFPFVAVVEHTNFIDPAHYHGHHLLYVGGYYPQNHRYFKMKGGQILHEFLPFLKKINPHFNFKFSILNFKLAANRYAQPIILPGYSSIIPPFKTPLPNIYLANMQQIYPYDRGINYAIELGERVARLVNEKAS